MLREHEIMNMELKIFLSNRRILSTCISEHQTNPAYYLVSWEMIDLFSPDVSEVWALSLTG